MSRFLNNLCEDLVNGSKLRYAGSQISPSYSPTSFSPSYFPSTSSFSSFSLPTLNL